MDPHSFSLLAPDPRGTSFKIKTEKCKEIFNNCIFIQIFQVNLYKLHFFYTFELGIFYSVSTTENYS